MQPDGHTERVSKQLTRVLESAQFSGAPRQQAFLRFVVTESLAGRGGDMKETLIATQVYEKPADYDPRVDSTVRVEASKLRQRLQHYYEGPGAADEIRLSIPKGAYQLLVELPPAAVATPPAPSEEPKPRIWKIAFGAMTALCLVLLALAAARFWRPPALDPLQWKVSRLTELGSFSSSPSVARRGGFVVYASNRESGGVLNLWRHPLDGGSPVRLSRSGFSHYEPTVSPDGSLVVFRSDQDGGSLAILPLTGRGIEQPIKDTAGARNPRFAPNNDAIVYWVPRDAETVEYGSVFLRALAPDGGSGAVRLFGDFAHAGFPLWGESGRHVLAVGTWHSNVPEKEFDAWTVELEDLHTKGTPRKSGVFPLLKEKGFYRSQADRTRIEVADWQDGWLYLCIPVGESRDLFRIRLRPETGLVEGTPERLTFGTGNIGGARIAADGTIVFVRPEISYDLFSLQAPTAREPGENLRRLTSETGINLRAVMGPDATTAAWEKRRTGRGGEVWFLDLVSGDRRKLGGPEDRAYTHILLSPDRKSAAFRASDPSFQPIFQQPVSGAPAVKICENCGNPTDWSADGKWLLYTTGGTPARIGILEIATRKQRDLIEHPSYNLFGARARINATGDGWIALYAANGDRTRQVFLVPMHGFLPAGQQEWVPITDGAHWDQSPAWAPDGRTLYYTSRHESFTCIMARELDPSGRPSGPPWAVRHLHSPDQTLMQSISNRGADALWVVGKRLYFMLDTRSSDVWTLGIK